MNWRLEILKKKSFKTINGIWNCWFAADFMEVMLVDKNKRGVSPHRELFFFFMHLLPKRKKTLFFCQPTIITIDLNIWTATHTNSYLITENLNRQETASSLTLFSPCSLSFFLELFRQFSGNSTIHYSTTQRAIPGVKRHVHLNMQINEFHRFHWPVSSWDSSASLMAKYLARWSTTKKKSIKINQYINK